MTSFQLLPTTTPWRTPLRWAAAVFFIVAGTNHFLHPTFYRRIIPPFLPAPKLLVAVSGVFEVIGGAGLLVRPLRRTAGWGLIALLIAVFPANIYMAACREQIPGNNFPAWLLWLRLPLQGVLVAWVWFAALGPRRGQSS